MRAFELQNDFGIDNLVRVTRDEPRAGPGEVMVRMRAASLNYRDLLLVKGHYNPHLKLPMVPLSDGVGEVTGVGEGVTRVAVGDRVASLFHQGWISGSPAPDLLSHTLGGPLEGVLRDHVVLHQDGVAKVPEHLSDLEAATLPCAALTAWSALAGEGDVSAGDTVVVQGTGGVSLFALQLAKLMGARVIITSSSDDKLERAKALGADHLINYRTTPQWAKPVLEITDGRGADHIVEVGGAGTIEQSLRAIRMDGRIAVIGVLSGVASELPITLILMKHVRLQGLMVGPRDSFEAMCRAISLHGMTPTIDRVFGFEEIKDALRYMGEGRHFGKICIDFG